MSVDASNLLKNQWQDFYRHMSDVVMLFDMNHRTILDANPAGLQFIQKILKPQSGRGLQDAIQVSFPLSFRGLPFAGAIEGLLVPPPPIDPQDPFKTYGLEWRDYNDKKHRLDIKIMHKDGSMILCLIQDKTPLAQLEEKFKNSEERLDQSQQLARVGHYEFDPVNNDLYWSNQVFRILGKKPQSFKPEGDNWTEYVHPDDRAHLFKEIDDAVREHRPFSARYRLCVPNQEVCRILTQGYATYDVHGKPIKVMGYVQDITERQRYEESLESLTRFAQQEKQKLQEAIDNLDEVFTLWDQDDRLLIYNKKMLEFYPGSEYVLKAGATFESIMRKGIEDGYFEIPAGWEKEKWIKYRANMHRKYSATEERVVNGRWLRISDQHTPNGYIVSTSIDITELKSREKQLHTANQKIEQASKAKSAFLAMMSHEIRTPIHAILSLNQLLSTTDLDSQQQQYCQDVFRSSNILLSLVNDFLDFSKLENTRMPKENDLVSWDHLVHEVNQLFQHKASQNNVSIRLENKGFIDKKIPIFISNKSYLRQILVNLVGNAVKFTQNGDVVIELRLLEQKNDHLLLECHVVDAGIGIPKGEEINIFKEFQQLDNELQQYHNGSGLGLAICKRMMLHLGGDMGVCTQRPKGADFWFRLPVIVSHSKVEKGSLSQVPKHMPVGPGAVDRASENIEKKTIHKILVAEDNPTNQKVIAAFLRKLGIDFDLVDNGQDVIASCGVNDYGMILMDIKMPIMDGIHAARILRQREHKTMPIIALTANTFDIEDGESFYKENGFDALLTKPYLLSDLKGVIDRFL